MLNSGSLVIKKLIDYYPENKITMIYGPGASGKTTCCFLSLIQCVKSNKKAVYIDTENGFNVERFKQLVGNSYLEVLNNTFLLKVDTFTQQRKLFRKLSDISLNKEIKLIIIDTIGNHYRRALKKNHYLANNAMLKQLRILSELSSKGKVVIIANQVYQNINKKNEIAMVGGNMVKNKGDCLIELQKTDYDKRYAVLRKHFDNKFEINKRIEFEIRDKGIFKKE
jgi:DNA repair protein RadB